MWTSILMALSLAAQADQPVVKAVPSVELDRYIGTWHEIARYPNRFQRSCAGYVSAFYERREDGRIRIVNRCRKADGTMNEAEGVARVVEGSGNARLRVRFAPSWLGFLPFVWANYWVIGLDPDYRWALVGTPDRKYLWILARDVSLPEESWNVAVAKARENGFDPARLQRTPAGSPK